MMIISNGIREGSWHVGEVMNIPKGHVITFTADGDELEWLFDIFQSPPAQEKLPGICYPAERLTPIF